MKWLYIFILSAVLCACAARAVKLDSEDIVWRESVMPAHWEQVFKNTINGFQTCTTVIPNCFVDPETRFANCDIYIIVVEGGASARQIGAFEVRAVDDKSTILRLGIQKSLAADKAFRQWRDYAAGIYECPETEAK